MIPTAKDLRVQDWVKQPSQMNSEHWLLYLNRKMVGFVHTDPYDLNVVHVGAFLGGGGRETMKVTIVHPFDIKSFHTFWEGMMDNVLKKMFK